MPASAPSTLQPSAGEREKFTFRQRLLLALIDITGSLAIRLIGPTLRRSVSLEDGAQDFNQTSATVYVFWHRCVFPAAWLWRGRDIQVMTSSSFDGESIARVSKRFGFGAVRGSSTRGGVRALLEMHTELDQGRSVAFTIDGPQGPMYVAKPGPLLLARNTQIPIQCFHIALSHCWELKSWDRFMVPKPFARAHLRLGRLLHVPAEADSAALERLRDQMQATLDRAWIEAEERVRTSSPR